MAYFSFPPAGFSFLVVFQGVGDQAIDSRFQSVGGLNVSLEMEYLKEGGENRFTHEFPSRASYTDLVLKRGLIKDSKLITWALNAFQNLEIEPVDLTVSLLNEFHLPLATWSIKHVIPKKWNVSEFNAEQNGIVVESFELKYHYFTKL